MYQSIHNIKKIKVNEIITSYIEGVGISYSRKIFITDTKDNKIQINLFSELGSNLNLIIPEKIKKQEKQESDYPLVNSN